MWHHFIILLGGYGLEAVAGYPNRIYRAISHPVVWMGAMIGWMDRTLNRAGLAAKQAKLAGVLTMVALLGVVIAAAFCIAELGWLAEMIGIAALLATRSLYNHVRDVERGVALTLDSGREAVAKIVGRDVMQLDTHGVSRAAIESLAESFCDGVVAPFFYALLFGLPGIAAYKAINTADSMIGHKDARYLHFGWAAARIDDVANFIPARISGILLALAGGAEAWSTMRRDARKHASPNAGWPEAAMAGALGVRLAGPKMYDGEVHDAPWIGEGREAAMAGDIHRALALYMRANVMLVFSACALALLM